MMYRDIVVIGASAGGVEALRTVVAGLPQDLPAAVLVVLHIPRSSPSALPAILGRSTDLPVRAAVDGEPLRPGRIYVAPADRHLLLLDHRVRLSRGASENGHRPAIDPLFRSAAYTFGPRTVGVVLSGTRDDGAAGLAAIVARGGVAVVQDPDDALHASMPRAALQQVHSEHVLPAVKIGARIAEMVRSEANESSATDPTLAAEVAMSDLAPLTTQDFFYAPAGYGCPACGGALFELPSVNVPRYRCRIGHAWSPETLLDEQATALESALWTALRVVEERAALSQRLVGNWAPDDLPHQVDRYRKIASDASGSASTIRSLIAGVGIAEDGHPTNRHPGWSEPSGG